jgi:hypothetical protein
VKRAFVGVLLTAVLAVGPMTAAQAVPPTGLSISIHDGSSELHSGDKLAYTATVRNSGTAQVEGRLAITVPAYVHVTDAAGAERTGADSNWTVVVPAGGSVTKKLVGVLGNIPKAEVRVTTLVSLYVGDATQPVIRSAESDTIAGVKDPAHAVSDRPAESAATPIGWIGLAGGAIALVVVVVLAWGFGRRRRIHPSHTGESR